MNCYHRTRKHLRAALFAVSATVLSGCGGGGETSTLQLDRSNLPGQIGLVAEVIVNGQNPATYNFDTLQPMTINLSGLSPEGANTIRVNWYKVSKGVALQLSYQNKTFDGSGAESIDSEHLDSSFDQDGDGISNLLELRQGTCPWVACDTENNFIDINTVVGVEYSDSESSITGNIILNSIDQWVETSFNASGAADLIVESRKQETTATSIFLFNRAGNSEYNTEINLDKGTIFITTVNGLTSYPNYKITNVLTM